MPTSPRLRAITLVSFTLVLTACGQSQQQGAGFHGMPPAEVTTIKLQPKTLPATYEYVGQTTGSKEVEVRARVTGILEKKLFQEGASVKAGQPLFVIDPQPLAAQTAALEAEVVRAQAQQAQAARELSRLKPLAEKRAVGQKEADDAQSNAGAGRGGCAGSGGAAGRNQAQPRLHAGDGADRGVVEPRAQVRGQPRQRQRHAAHHHLASRSDVDPVLDRRERAARSSTRR